MARPEGAFALEMLDLRLSPHVRDPLHLWAENGDGFVFPTTASDSPDNDPDPGTTIKSDMTTYSEEEEGGDYIDENGNGLYDSGEPLIVTATRIDDDSSINIWNTFGSVDYTPDNPTIDGSGGYNPDYQDDGNIDVVVNIDRVLT